MGERKPFLVRLDPATMDALRAWAADDLRSLNGQIEFVLRRALRDASRLPPSSRVDQTPGQGGGDGPPAGRTRAAPERQGRTRTPRERATVRGGR